MLDPPAEFGGGLVRRGRRWRGVVEEERERLAEGGERLPFAVRVLVQRDRGHIDGGDAFESAGPAFRWRGQNSTMAGLGALVDVSFNFDAEPAIPAGDSVASLLRLRRLKMWHVRMEALIHQRLESLRGASAEREFQCKKIVALCAGAPVDKVEGVCLLKTSLLCIADI